MSIINAFPTNLQNGTIEDAAQVMSLFAWIQSQTNGGACPATSGGIVLKGDGAGGTSPAVPDIDYASPASAVPIGSIIDYAGATPPAGYLPCDGRALSRTGYALLFSKIGTIWGVGDGSTTFNIPNTGGRTAVFYGFGAGTGSGAGSGTVSSITIASTNGFSGIVVNPSTTAIITLSTSVTGVLKGSTGALAVALNSDLPVMSSTVGGAVPTPPNLTTHYLRGDGSWRDFGVGIFNFNELYVTNTANATSPITGPLRSAGGGSITKDFHIGGNLYVNTDIYQQYSAPGVVIGSSVANLDNTNANSGASVLIAVGGAGAGDPTVQYFVNGVASWVSGIDNSDGGKFKISCSPVLGLSDYLIIDSVTGKVTLPGGLTITGVDQRVQCDLSNATISSRLFFQTSTLNGNSNFGVLPNGTATVSGIQANNASDASNCHSFIMSCGPTEAVIQTFGRGTSSATPLPINFSVNGFGSILNLGATGLVGVNGCLGRGLPVVKTADFAVAANENWLINNKAGSTCTVTLPLASTFPGREIELNNYQAFTVVSASANVIPLAGGAAGTAIIPATVGKWVTLVSDSTNWRILRSN